MARACDPSGGGDQEDQELKVSANTVNSRAACAVPDRYQKEVGDSGKATTNRVWWLTPTGPGRLKKKDHKY